MDGLNVAMSIACKTDTEKIFVETIDCQPKRNGDNWIMKFLSQANIEKVVVDGNGSQILEEEMKEAHLKAPVLPKVGEVITR